MIRRLIPLLLIAFLAGAPSASAAETTFFGPIVPIECQSCPCGFAGVLEIARHLMNFAVSFGIILLTFMLAWGGLLYILSATNPENRSQANKIITGGVIGMILILTSWLIVDFVMRTLYSGPDGTAGKYGPWNSILAEDADWCIVAMDTKPLFNSFPLSGPPTTNPTDAPTNTGGTIDPTADGKFSYQSEEIRAQLKDASPALISIMSCMAARVPSNVGQISAITEKAIASGQRTMAYCAEKGCAHSVNSCHYGGRSCVGKSYAIDFGDEKNAAALIKAANACGAKRAALENGNHVHVTAASDCGCS